MTTSPTTDSQSGHHRARQPVGLAVFPRAGVTEAPAPVLWTGPPGDLPGGGVCQIGTIFRDPRGFARETYPLTAAKCLSLVSI